MSNEVLNSLLREYEQKKLKAELDLERRKDDLYKKFPRLQQIDDELNHFAINTAKSILLHLDSSSKDSLKQKIETLKYEKACILQDANISLDYLKPYYECQICKDTGYVSNNFSKTQMCSCLKQKLLNVSFNKSNIANLDKENFGTFNENLFSDDVDFAKYNFNISPRQNIKIIRQKCMSFVQDFDNPNTKNLLFTGNTGLR